MKRTDSGNFSGLFLQILQKIEYDDLGEIAHVFSRRRRGICHSCRTLRDYKKKPTKAHKPELNSRRESCQTELRVQVYPR
jgi:hypothetical protein